MITQGLLELLSYTVQGLGAYRALFSLQAIQAVATLAFAVIGIWRWGVPGFYGGQAIATASCAVIASAVLRQRIGFPFGRPSRGLFAMIRNQLGASVHIYLAKIFQTSSVQAPLLISGLFLMRRDIGYLKFALGGSTHILPLSAAVNSINLAEFSRAVRDGRPEGLAPEFVLAFRRFCLVSAFATTTAIGVARLVILVLGGVRYLPALATFEIAVASMFIVSVLQVLASGCHVPGGTLRINMMAFALQATVTAMLTMAAVRTPMAPRLIVPAFLCGSVCALIYSARGAGRSLGCRLVDGPVMLLLIIPFAYLTTVLLTEEVMLVRVFAWFAASAALGATAVRAHVVVRGTEVPLRWFGKRALAAASTFAAVQAPRTPESW